MFLRNNPHPTPKKNNERKVERLKVPFCTKITFIHWNCPWLFRVNVFLFYLQQWILCSLSNCNGMLFYKGRLTGKCRGWGTKSNIFLKCSWRSQWYMSLPIHDQVKLAFFTAYQVKWIMCESAHLLEALMTILARSQCNLNPFLFSTWKNDFTTLWIKPTLSP